MAKKLAFMTVGMLHEPVGHPRVQGFVDRIPAAYEAADKSVGFVERSERHRETLEHSWGPVRVPKCFACVEDVNRMPSTLSIWEDLESVAAYAYNGVHGEAMKKRREWFQAHNLPTHVAWWVEEGHRIDWTQACDRLDHLHDHGASAFAFNFARPFDADGWPFTMNPEAVRERIKTNAERMRNG